MSIPNAASACSLLAKEILLRKGLKLPEGNNSHKNQSVQA